MGEDADTGVSRRKMLGGGAAMAGLALAGCVGATTEQKKTDNAQQNATKAAELQPPSKPLADIHTDQQAYREFVVNSLAFQNQVSQLQAQALAEYMEAEHADANNEG